MLFHLLQHFYVQQMADIPYLLSDISIPVGNMWVMVFNHLTEWVLQALGGRPPSSPSTCSPPGTTPPTAASSTATWVVTLYYCCVNINVIRVIMCANLATVCWDNQQPIEPVHSLPLPPGDLCYVGTFPGCGEHNQMCRYLHTLLDIYKSTYIARYLHIYIHC